MNYQDYIKTELLILVPVLYFIGVGLKRSKIRDKFIPMILGIVAVIMACCWIIATEDISGMNEFFSALFTAVTQGVLTAGASVYVNQLHIQAKKEE